MEARIFYIPLTAPSSADTNDYVMIEQEPWADDVGRTSNAQGIMAIGSMIFGGSLPLPNCGGLNGFGAPVYTYPSRLGLNYTFDVSHGQIQPGTISMLTREEIIQCSLQESAETDYPVARMQSMQWIGQCYDERGRSAGRPQIKQNGRTLSFTEKVFGSLRIKYSVIRQTHLVRIEEREDSIENNFDSVAFVRWDGGVDFKEITAPSGYDATTGNCGNGFYPGTPTGGSGGTGVTEACPPTGGQGSYPKAVRANRKTTIEYCSQEVDADTVTESVERDSDDNDCDDDDPIITN